MIKYRAKTGQKVQAKTADLNIIGLLKKGKMKDQHKEIFYLSY
jgi:hypothetical protein